MKPFQKKRKRKYLTFTTYQSENRGIVLLNNTE